MFTWLHRRRLQKERQRLERLNLQLLEQARDLQRGGDIRGFASTTDEAAAVERQTDDWNARHAAPRATST